MSTKVFISYSHKDECFKDELCEHLSSLRRQGVIDDWNDRKITPGSEWKNDIDKNLLESELILFLVSSSFMNSDYCNDIELKKALRLHSEGTAHIIPIIIRAVDWSGSELASLQALPKDAKAVQSWSDKDEAWVNVINGIKEHIEVFHQEKSVRKLNVYSKNLQFHNPLIEWIDDTEISLTHRHTSKIILSDIYVLPDVKFRDLDSEDMRNISSAEKINSYNYSVILGDEQQGKTSLLKYFYKNFLNENKHPIFLDGESINDIKHERMLGKVIKKQYDIDYADYLNLSEDKIILIDNIDKISLNSKFKEIFFKEITKLFDKCIFTSSLLYECSLNELSSLDNFKVCSIMGMGNRKREDLILKWVSLGQEHTINDDELYSKCDELKHKINLIIKKNIVPTKPIYIIMLIQWFETHNNLNIELSSYGYCYERLIYQSFQNAKIDSRNIDKYLNILTELSWVIFINGSNPMDNNTLELFFKEYKKEYILDEEPIIENLTKCLILKITEEGFITFKYPYIYYFFVAKKIAESYTKDKDEFNAHVDELVENIYKEDFANILIFITHHTKDEWILDKIKFVLSNLFRNQKPSTLDKEQLGFMKEFITKIPDLVIEQREIKEERSKYNQNLDDYEMINEKDNIPDELESKDLFKIINKVFKGIEISGQIINNRYASLKRTELTSLASNGILCGLRFLNHFIELTDMAKNEIIKVISNHLYENPNLTNKQIGKFAESAYLLLTYSVISDFIRKISISIGSKDAFEIYQNITYQDQDTPAIILIKQTIELHFNKKLDFKKLKDNYEKLKSNPVCIRILREIVIQHIYLFPVSTREKQQLSTLLNLPIVGQELISQKQKRIGY
ncbi:toll/interleukin-1 receptor domain-containing protein [Glaesserella parasuis]|nr:toll/interleukin-1 receptor domain-containing protein [Glaesserella parasuis]MDP0290836.1 toll/interleukin-1 receptor domain-containing protein [Glaesserella parasuis]MDP0292930.1 toll/interleukin-1 receptor domain-containing protein [Glaesserella parasuis]MDP0297161.1 toll/interleukin-1 receptor domain-containing protein [Glaesserella parasuis]MDP0301437.1 toll/interleukin-1 receptor domain-containing protein [Glaesserella parasuis]